MVRCAAFGAASWISLAAVCEAVTVRPAPLESYLPNPGIGFQAMHNLNNPVMPETVAYRRSQYGWNLQNPAPGVYDWSSVDADLAAAAALGKQLSFRIYTMRGENYGGHRVPAWVLSEGATLIAGGQPRYSNCVYQQRWGEFVEALRQRYDGNPDIAFIDISGYGNFNEWSWQSQTRWDDDWANPTTLDGMARRRLADMFIGGAGTIQCATAGGGTSTVSYSYPGFQHTQLVMPYAGIQQSTRYVASRRSDVGFRHDCLGSPGHTDGILPKLGDVLAGIWPNAPVVFEFCSVVNMSAADSFLRATHGSIVHENWGGDDIGQLTNLLRHAGYRFELREATFPGASFRQGSIEVGMVWRNVGYAPAYARMGQDFELHFLLLGPQGGIVAAWVVSSDPNGWMPADPVSAAAPEYEVAATLDLPPGLQVGPYTAATGIFDLRTGRYIGVASEGADDSNRLVLGTIQFSDGEVCGDGLLRPDLGEQCDDGNGAEGDCCSAECRIESGACDDGNPCTTQDACSSGSCVGGPPPVCDDGIDCTVDSCTPEQGCVAEPAHGACDDGIDCTADLCDPTAGCSNEPDDTLCDDGDLCTTEICDRQTLQCESRSEPLASCLASDSASIVLSSRSGKRKLVWKWRNGTIEPGSLGAPSATTAYALCIHDGPRLAMSANIPAGLRCGATASCWQERPTSLRFERSSAQPEGVSSVKILAGRAGRDLVQLKGKSSSLGLPAPALPGAMFTPGSPVSVQVRNSEGACWGAEFTGSEIRTNREDIFQAARR